VKPGASAAERACPAFAELDADELRLRLRVQPRASRTRILGVRGDSLAVAVQAPPVDGAANAAVVALVADWLGVAKSRVEVLRGATGRAKTLRVVGPPGAALLERLGAVPGR
jgi:uncharacterized protein (TIGR00251 family)